MAAPTLRAANPVKPRKVCVIGSTGHKHVTCVAWDGIDSINLVDFDCVFVIVETLPQQYWNRSSCSRVRNHLSRLLASGGLVIVLGDRMKRLDIQDGAEHTNYVWSPIEIWQFLESGDTIEIKENMFPKLFSHFKRWNFYYDIPEKWYTEEILVAFDFDVNELKMKQNPLIQNRYGRPLAILLSIRTGSFVLLPGIEDLEIRHKVNLVLEDLLGTPQETLPPAWAESVSMPRTPEIQADIDSKRGRVNALEAEIAERQREKQEIEKFKKLLYGDGKELEEIFALCLEQLGGKVKPAQYSEEEFVLEYKGELYLVECKGVGKSIALNHVRQLSDYMFEFEEDEGKPGKGILFGNAWKGLPLQERGTTSTVIFPENVIARASSLGIALVNSVDFFDAYMGFLAGQVSGETILDRITSSTGVVSFQNATWKNE